MRSSTLPLPVLAALLLVHSWAWAARDLSTTAADRVPSEVASTWFEQLYDADGLRFL
jgi:hypothetical protein